MNPLVIFDFYAEFRCCPSIELAAYERNFMKLQQVVQLPIGLPTVILWPTEGLLLHLSPFDRRHYVRTRGFEFS